MKSIYRNCIVINFTVHKQYITSGCQMLPVMGMERVWQVLRVSATSTDSLRNPAFHTTEGACRWPRTINSSNTIPPQKKWYRIVQIIQLMLVAFLRHIPLFLELRAHCCLLAKQHPPVLVSTTMDQRLKNVISLENQARNMGIRGCTGDVRLLGCD